MDRNLSVVEKNEYVLDGSNNLYKIAEGPTHDQKALIFGNKKFAVQKGRGGVVVEDAKQVISATQENRRRKDSTYQEEDAKIEIDTKEQKLISRALDLPFKFKKKKISPSQLLTNLIESKNKKLEKFMNQDYSNSQRASTTLKANETQLKQIPDEKMLFDFVIKLQEDKKMDY